MWIFQNPNPKKKIVPDCVIRAICIALQLSWYEVFDILSELARAECSVTCDDQLWGKLLYRMGFTPFAIPLNLPTSITIKQFCKMFPHCRYIIGPGSHAVAIIDGNYYDSWDSGNEIPSFFWRIAN